MKFDSQFWRRAVLPLAALVFILGVAFFAVFLQYSMWLFVVPALGFFLFSVHLYHLGARESWGARFSRATRSYGTLAWSVLGVSALTTQLASPRHYLADFLFILLPFLFAFLAWHSYGLFRARPRRA